MTKLGVVGEHLASGQLEGPVVRDTVEVVPRRKHTLAVARKRQTEPSARPGNDVGAVRVTTTSGPETSTWVDACASSCRRNSFTIGARSLFSFQRVNPDNPILLVVESTSRK